MDRPDVGIASRKAWRRVWRQLLLVLAVLAAHLWVTRELVLHLAAWSPGNGPVRKEIVFTRQLELSDPPVVGPAPARPAPVRPAPAPPATVAALPATGASAPERVQDEPEVEPIEAAASEPAVEEGEAASTIVAEEPPLSTESSQVDATSQAEPASAAAPLASASAAGQGGSAGAGSDFEWPPSARVSYTLQGHYRGEVRGSAQVEWIRSGEHYQVHIDVLVGPSFAPLITRRMSSDGLITPDGLAPRAYDEETRVAFRTRRAAVRFGPDWITLNNGREVPAPPGVQDTASQFVQLTQRLTLNPELLTPGQSIEFPLALPRRQDLWFYDVVGAEDLATPFGTVQAYHLRPRRETKRRDELVADVWFAPRLLYLPVRIMIRQDEENYVDLMISKLPDIAEPATAEVTRETPP